MKITTTPTPGIIKIEGVDRLRDNLAGVSILHQDEAWVDRDDQVHLLTAMSPRHRKNLLAFLRRRAFQLEMRDALFLMGGPLAPRGDMACDAVDALLDERAEDPGRWLETTKLVTRLRELVEQDERDAENVEMY